MLSGIVVFLTSLQIVMILSRSSYSWSIFDNARLDHLIYQEWRCLSKVRKRAWIGLVQGAVATWSNHQSPKSIANIDAVH
jgi:hypothetical protein